MVSKAYHSLNVLKSKVQSLFLQTLNYIIPYNIKIKNRSHFSNILWYRIYITIPKHREGSIVRKYCTKARTKSSWANSKLCILMSDVEGLFRLPTLFSFVDCSILLSLALAPLPVSSSPQQLSHSSRNSNILGSSRQSSLQFHSFTQWPF